MAGCWFSHARFLIATQVLDWDIQGFIAILLREDSSVLADIGAQTVSGITNLKEFNGTGYARQPVVSTAITEEVGIAVHFTADDVVFTGLGNGTTRARWTLIAMNNGVSDTVRIPMFVVGRALGPIHPNGGSIRTPLDAMW